MEKQQEFTLEMLKQIRDSFRNTHTQAMMERLHRPPDAREDIRRALAGEGVGERPMETVSPEAYERIKAQIREQRRLTMEEGEQVRPHAYQVSTEDGGTDYMAVPPSHLGRREIDPDDDDARELTGFVNVDDWAAAQSPRAWLDVVDNLRMASPPRYMAYDPAGKDYGAGVMFYRDKHGNVSVEDIRLIESEDDDQLRGPPHDEKRARQLQISRGEKHGPPRSKYARKRW